MSVGSEQPLGYPCQDCAAKPPTAFCDPCRSARRRVQQRASEWLKRHGVPYKEVTIPPQAVPALVNGLTALRLAIAQIEEFRNPKGHVHDLRNAIEEVLRAGAVLEPVLTSEAFLWAEQLVVEVAAGRLPPAPRTMPEVRSRRPTGPKPGSAGKGPRIS